MGLVIVAVRVGSGVCGHGGGEGWEWGAWSWWMWGHCSLLPVPSSLEACPGLANYIVVSTGRSNVHI